MWLKHTKVYRGAVSAARWGVETTDCRFEVVKGECRFLFNISSKGGGRTALGVYVSPQDLTDVLAAIATGVPGSALMLSRAAAEAVADLDRTATEANETLTRCGDAVESWDELATERYHESDDDHDELEREMDLASETWRGMARTASALGRVVSGSAESPK